MRASIRSLALLAVCACTSTAGLAGGGDQVPDGGSAPDAADATAPLPDASAFEAAPDGPCSNDLQTDAKNCGACGHDCLGGVCSAGTCLPVIAAVPGDAGATSGLTIDPSGTLYWVNYVSGAILRGGATIASSTPNGPSGIAVHGGLLYWTNYADGTLTRAALDGGAPTPLVASLGNPGCFDFDAQGRIYVSDYGAGRVVRIDGAVVTPILTNLTKPWGVAVSGAQIYVSEYTATGTILTAGLDGSGAKPLATGEDYPGCIAVDGTSLYWADNDDTGGVRRMDLATGIVTWFATGGAELGIAIDAKSVYWANESGTTIFRLAR
jgi:hypothetical protein